LLYVIISGPIIPNLSTAQSKAAERAQKNHVKRAKKITSKEIKRYVKRAEISTSKELKSTSKELKEARQNWDWIDN
jgi:hypothetical protein